MSYHDVSYLKLPHSDVASAGTEVPRFFSTRCMPDPHYAVFDSYKIVTNTYLVGKRLVL